MKTYPLGERLRMIWSILNCDIDEGRTTDQLSVFAIYQLGQALDEIAALETRAARADALERLLVERETAAADQAGGNVVAFDARRPRPAPGNSPTPDGTPSNHGGAA